MKPLNVVLQDKLKTHQEFLKVLCVFCLHVRHVLSSRLHIINNFHLKKCKVYKKIFLDARKNFYLVVFHLETESAHAHGSGRGSQLPSRRSDWLISSRRLQNLATHKVS